MLAAGSAKNPAACAAVLAILLVMSATTFAKYEGLGNDFVVLDLAEEDAFDVRQVPALCDRRLGVGADGVLLVLPATSGSGAAARMRVLNADGGVPEMCGNGLRCVALHVARARGRLEDAEVVIETDSGARRCRVSGGARDEAEVDVEMGIVRFVREAHLSLEGGQEVDVAIVDAGNPHAIVLRCDPPADLDAIGPLIARHAEFPRGTNVELRTMQREEIDVVVWERGVGRTLACGTGACAVVAEACRAGLVRSGAPVRVRLPGGVLVVTRDDASGETRLEGPARLVFRGELPARAVPSK
jgi:diaminopimelate epimerase